MLEAYLDMRLLEEFWWKYWLENFDLKDGQDSFSWEKIQCGMYKATKSRESK